MHPSSLLLLLLFLLPTATLSSSSHASNRNEPLRNSSNNTRSVGCLSHEKDALLAFKEGIINDPAGRLASWQEGEEDCCLWRGVDFNNRTGHVISLRLSNVQDDPLLGPEDTALFGQISPSLLSLQHLQHLDLSMNDLSGPTTHLPRFLGLLKNLRYLDLSGIPFSGMVPPQLGNLSKLHYLYLSPNNNFSISLPNLYSNDISWLTNLPLRYLGLDFVNLSSQAHWANVLNMIPSLKSISLTGCSLTSANQSLPYLNITDPTELTLSRNYFYHPVTSCWFWNLTNLQLLYLTKTELYGKIPESLGRMMSLHVLGLSHNDGHIDITTANMTYLCNLESLYISQNKLNGDIVELLELLPQCWPNKLKELYLGGNNLTGALPKWIGQRWPRLSTLIVDSNELTGPVPSEISMLNSLTYLVLSGNHLTGPVPSEISMLNNLNVLDLSSNQLTGPVPSEISILNNLILLDLSVNGFKGLITHEHLAGLESLKYLDLSYTALKIVLDQEWSPPFRLHYAYFASCHMGPLFPSWLQSQTDIVDLNITRASIVDKLPDWFTTTFLKAWRLDISNNAISGTLPANFENMTSLEKVYLNSNSLNGPIPQLPKFLFEFVGSENSFSGPLPSNFGTQDLHYINIASNRITGHIPWSFCQLKNLVQLNMANNLLHGEFPQCFQSKTAKILILRNNKLSGKFPAALKVWRDLYVLDLAWNMFVGTLPMWIGDFAQLKIFELSHNMFNGSIPATITRLGNLSYLNLAGNCISGHLPLHLSNLTGMRRTSNAISYYNPFNSFPAHVNLSVITKGQERSYKDGEVYEIVSIDFSSNQLIGGIPEEITSLDGVINMNLSWNLFSGNIPSKIGLLQSLESLDLKENKLYGEIPQSMSSLTYLSVLDLSYNNLTGRIPSGGQLDTLYQQNPFMYDGNSGLCGFPLPKNCSNSTEPKLCDKTKHEHDSTVLQTFWFGLCIGYLVGLWVIFCVILFMKSWRLAYFCLLDKIYGFLFGRVFV